MVAKPDNAAGSSDVSLKNLTARRPNKGGPDSARDQASLATTSRVSRAKSFVFSAVIETIVNSAKLQPQSELNNDVREVSAPPIDTSPHTCFRIYFLEGPGKLDGTKMKWVISVAGLY
jgi:hypothetical protein